MKNHYPYVFQVKTFYYDHDECHSITHTCAGVGFCESYADAMQQIEKVYGDELLEVEYLSLIGEKDETIIPVKPEWVKDLSQTDMFFGDECE